MKIIGVGRNYSDHIKELNNDDSEEPVIFLKPDTALLKNNQSFYIPSFSNNIHHEIELIIKINREGKNIEEKFSSKYFNEIGLGIDFTARDIQQRLKEKGLPWTLAKGFDNSAVVSEFIPLASFKKFEDINFTLKVNGELRQKGNSGQMIHHVFKIIAFISKYITLKTGDIIFTGTPAGVQRVNIGDKLEGFIEEQKLLDFEIK